MSAHTVGLFVSTRPNERLCPRILVSACKILLAFFSGMHYNHYL